ncbi:MAG: PH domain-containing protein [Kineosporiaceae bacterium]
MQIDERNGVRVLSADAPGPLTASLMFRVGRRDESFIGGGVTHLVEHLVMASLGRSHLDCNASVDLTLTEFTATGRPEAVADFLTRVCAALRDVPTQRLAAEAGVLEAEGGMACHPLAGYLMSRRYGAVDVGLAGLREPAIPAITADAVRAWARTHFVTGNAVAWFSGPVPDGLDLTLPDGPARSPLAAAPPRVPLPYPVWVEHPHEDGVGLAFEVDADAVRAAHAPAADWDDQQFGVVAGMLCRLLEQRVEDDLRHGRGLSYEVGYHSARAGAGVVHATVHADSRTRDAAVAATVLVGALRAIAEAGPQQADLDFDLEGLREFVADPRAVLAALDDAATRLLHGVALESDEQLVARHDRVSAADVAAVARVALPTMLLGVPEGVRPQVPGVAEEPDDWQSPVTGREHGRRFRSDAPRGSSLVVGDAGITLRLPTGLRTVRWDDVIGLGRHPEGYYRLSRSDGNTIPLDARDWKDGDAVIATVLARVPESLRYDEPAEDHHPGDGHDH